MTHPFITHNGGPCPVSPETEIDVLFKDGTTMKGLPAAHFLKEWWEWARKRQNKAQRKNNIIAYRLHQPATTQPTEV